MTAKKSKKEKRLDRLKRKSERIAAGSPVHEVVYLENGTQSTVVSKGFSLRGFDHQYQLAARRFQRDWEVTKNSGLRCQGFEPGVDGGKKGAAHLARAAAANRIFMLRKELGERDSAILIAIIIHEVSPRWLADAGGPQRNVITNELKRILRRVDDFYAERPVQIDPLWKLAAAKIEEMEYELELRG